ncbi:hypothetical protein F3Y22_tig00111280pilonHSYRG00063 [Hibiscus syriacus]|uniref:SCP domain-containing protein n=1 Tax=Hibiscus syriacus TaxID=106335 RepID=A0A6A2YRK8_HIBSY|nr:hypothetical protein F3Y22_tig00111280pilonHSYRG00063 [Hibiscus syriacus]
MEFSSLALTCLMAFTLILPSHAQDSPQDYLNLNAHNEARAAVSVGPMSWDETVLPLHGTMLINASPIATLRTPVAVDNTGRLRLQLQHCASGKVCGHYTQVVWRDSVRLGCQKPY